MALIAVVGSTTKCPLVTPGVPPVPHTAGGIVGPPGIPTVLVEGKPVACIGHPVICAGPPPHPDIIVGQPPPPKVLIGGLPVAREGDLTQQGGKIAKSLAATVEIGG